jgi:hypothetical protein
MTAQKYTGDSRNNMKYGEARDEDDRICWLGTRDCATTFDDVTCL